MFKQNVGSERIGRKLSDISLTRKRKNNFQDTQKILQRKEQERKL